MNNLIFMKYTLLVFFFFIAGCNGFNKSGGTTAPQPDQKNLVADLNYQLSIRNGPYDGQLVIDQIRNSYIKILIPMGINNSLPLGDFNSPTWDVSGKVTQNQFGLKIIEIKLPASQIIQGVNSPEVSALPNGEALDFIAGGLAQHYSFTLGSSSNVKLHFYFRPPFLMGVFVQTPFDITFAHKYSVTPSGSFLEAGFFSTHPHNPPLEGGSFLFISLPQ
jgi:hypothetical protein